MLFMTNFWNNKIKQKLGFISSKISLTYSHINVFDKEDKHSSNFFIQLNHKR